MFDWIVFDSSTLLNSFSHSAYLEMLLQACCDHKITLANSCTLRIPNTVSTIFELESLQSLTPSAINNYSIFILDFEPFSLFDEFNSWLKGLCEKSEFFKKVEKTLKVLYAYFIEDSVEYVFSLSKTKKIAAFSRKFYLRNFTNLLEIFLNELRKSAFAHGYFEDPKVLSGEKVT